MKKIQTLIATLLVLSSCVTMTPPRREVLTADSEPYKDAGTPLAGSFKNGERVKGSIYLTAALLTMASSLLFAPLQEDGKGVIPLDDMIAVPLSLGLLGAGVSVALIASPIDTAISYHKRNSEIMRLNSIDWKPGTLTKYQAILKHREDIKLKQIENFRRRFAEGTVTDTEIYMISSDEFIYEALKVEVEGYVARRKVLKNAETAD